MFYVYCGWVINGSTIVNQITRETQSFDTESDAIAYIDGE